MEKVKNFFKKAVRVAANIVYDVVKTGVSAFVFGLINAAIVVYALQKVHVM